MALESCVSIYVLKFNLSQIWPINWMSSGLKLALMQSCLRNQNPLEITRSSAVTCVP